jgi:transcriptional regulator with XRE-family HTH domain
MRPSEFKRWRKSLRMSQKQAAEALGLKRRMVQYYEKGVRDGEKVEVPKSVRLACCALAEGIADYHGPEAKQPAGKPATAPAAAAAAANDSGDS